jgi:hypothetical protein
MAVFAALAAIVMAALTWVETALGTPMRAAGMPPDLQLAIGVVVAILVIFAAIQLFGGFIRLLVIVLLVSLVVHAVGNRALLPPTHEVSHPR